MAAAQLMRHGIERPGVTEDLFGADPTTNRPCKTPRRSSPLRTWAVETGSRRATSASGCVASFGASSRTVKIVPGPERQARVSRSVGYGHDDAPAGVGGDGFVNRGRRARR